MQRWPDRRILDLPGIEIPIHSGTNGGPGFGGTGPGCIVGGRTRFTRLRLLAPDEV